MSWALLAVGLLVGWLLGYCPRRRAWARDLEAAKKEYKSELHQRLVNGLRMLEE